MTIDETGKVITMNELIVTGSVRPVLDQENMTMIKTALAAIGNTLVDASQLAHDFEDLKQEVKALREETQRANHFREIADQAYQQVNAQRIAAESELTTIRFEKNALQSDKDHLQFDVQSLMGRLNEANGRIAALEADQSKMIEEFDRAVSEARAETDRKVEAERQHWAFKVENLEKRIEEQDKTIFDLQSKLHVSEQDNRTLRQMLDEGKRALKASLGVFEGELAAE